MTVPILIDLNIEKDSKVCDGCRSFKYDSTSGLYGCDYFNNIICTFKNVHKHSRLKQCLHAQQRAEDLMRKKEE